MSEAHASALLVSVGDHVTARSGATGTVCEVCGDGVWIVCADPAPYSDYGNPVAVGWGDVIAWTPNLRITTP